MKVHIKAYHAVATWRWDLPGQGSEDLCGICQHHYDQTCDKCVYPGDGCGLST